MSGDRDWDDPLRIGSGSGSDVAAGTDEVTVLTVATYANANGIVDDDGLLAAIGDWRNEHVGTLLLLDVVGAWRTGDPVT